MSEPSRPVRAAERRWRALVAGLVGVAGLAMGPPVHGAQRMQAGHTTEDPGSAPAAQAGPEADQPPLDLVEGVAAPTPGAPTIDLARAVAVALEHNFGLLAQADRLEAARFGEQAAQARFRPQFTPQLSYARDERVFGAVGSQELPWTGGRLTASAAFRQPDGAQDTTSFAVGLEQPLLQGFGPTVARFDLVNSRRSRQGQERFFELARQRLAVTVTAAYYQVLRQRQLLRVAQRSAERSDGLRERSEARLRVGLASRLDVLRAELQASQALDAAVGAEAALETALEKFRALLGLAPGVPLEPAALALTDSVRAATDPVEVLVARALDNRLELREARDAIEDARRSSSVARQRLLPQLDLNLVVTRTGAGDGFSGAFRPSDDRLDIFVSSSYPVERSSDRAASAVAALAVVTRQRELRQRELDVEAEVRAAARELTRIRKSVELQRKGMEYADRQYRLATLRYERGLDSNFDVVEAEASLVAARTALVGLLSDLQVARVQLLVATGELDVDTEFDS